jgi:hypothetical protein
MQDQSYFHRLSNDALNHALRDISKAISIAATWEDNGVGECKYLDQYHAALAERNRRTERNVCSACKRAL